MSLILLLGRDQIRDREFSYDDFGTHESLDILKFCFENNIVLCRLLSYTSHKLQPCDVGAFTPLKTAYREQVERLYCGGANVVCKQHFTSPYSRARDQAFTSRSIISGWSKTGLYPFNPDRVLQDIQKRQAELFIPQDTTSAELSPYIELLQTPVTSKALTLLHCTIEKDALDGLGESRLQRLANAAEKAFAERALLLDENRLLFEQNNESRTRLSIKTNVVDKAKVVST